MNIQEHEGLLVDDDTNTAIGYLFDFTGHGIYSPNGKVEIPADKVEAHNNALSQGEIAGLDKAEIGQCGTLYWSVDKGVHTFVGTHVADYDISTGGKTLTFRRPNGHVFRGRTQKDADCFNFKRIR